MTNVLQLLRSAIPGHRPTGLQPGEVYINFADRKFGYIDEAGYPQDIDGGASVGPDAPQNPTEGQLWFETGLKDHLYVFHKEAWRDVFKLPEFVTASFGPADAGRLVALDDEGKIDPSMLPEVAETSGGDEDAGKLVALNAEGKVDETMLPPVASVSASAGDEDAGKLVALNAVGQVDETMLPVGMPKGGIIMWSGALTAIPAGWFLCDGANGTPDLRNRFIVGAGGEYVVGQSGGAKEVALTEAQMPSHAHGFSAATDSQGEHTHQYNLESQWSVVARSGTVTYAYNSPNNVQTKYPTSRAGAHSHNVSGATDVRGSGAAHENRPPFFALAYIMKA